MAPARRRLLAAATGLAAVGCSLLADTRDLASDGDAASGLSDSGSDTDAAEDATTTGDARGDAATDAQPPPECAPDASFVADPHNCGRCGRDCLGGQCKQGSCQPFALTSGQAGTYWMAVDPTNVYWTDGADIRSCPKAGCDAGAATLQSGRASVMELATGGGRLFWTECSADAKDGGTFSCAPDATGCTPSAHAGGSCFHGVAYDESSSLIYYADMTWGLVYRCPFATCASAVAEIARDRIFYVSSIGILDGAPFWLEAQVGLNACASPNCLPAGARRVASSQRNAITTPSFAGSFAYWTAYLGGPTQRFAPQEIPQIVNGGVLVRASVAQDGGYAEILASGGSPTAVVADDDAVRFTDHLGGTIMSCPPSGCDAGPSVIAIGQGKPFALVQDDEAIYWGNYGDGRIMKLAK